MRKLLPFLLLPIGCGGVSDVAGAFDGSPNWQTGTGGNDAQAIGGAATGGAATGGAATGGAPPLGSGGTQSGGAQTTGPRVLPAGQLAYGLSHEEWLARFWQWFLSLPKTNHPREGGDCSQGQAGGVWFLTTGHNGLVETRECTIPAGTALFIPTTAELLYPRPDCASSCSKETDGPTAWHNSMAGRLENSLEDLAEDRVTVELDGELLPVGIDYLWETTQEFFVHAPDQDGYFSCIGNIGDPKTPWVETCGWPGGSARPFASAGFAAMVTPLPVGTHVLRFGARAFTWSWQTDVTYVIEVVP